MTKPHILTVETYDDWDIVPMEELFVVHKLPASGNVLDLPSDTINQIRAIAFRGHTSLTAQMMDSLPNLGLIANYGVGYDTIDVAHAAARGIRVTNTPDVLTDDVADLAVGMVIARSRDIVGASDWIRSGNWTKNGAFALQRKVTEKRVGIVGLGRIGRAVAERLQPFQMDIHYYARAPKDTPGWTHHEDITALAKAVDILIVTLSGGPETAKMIGRETLAALGPEGLLVNTSRGTTIDEAALLNALEDGTLGAAALDVYENEPNIDPRFAKLDNVLLQPHQSSGTIETRKVMGKLQRDNLVAFFDGKPLLTPVC